MKLFETSGLTVSVTDCGAPLLQADYMILGEKTDIQAIRLVSELGAINWKDFVRRAAEQYIASIQEAVDKLNDD